MALGQEPGVKFVPVALGVGITVGLQWHWGGNYSQIGSKGIEGKNCGLIADSGIEVGTLGTLETAFC